MLTRLCTRSVRANRQTGFFLARISKQLIELHFPGSISLATFVRDYWQKQPLVLRGAFDARHLIPTPEELAGFALETEFESRLIRQFDDGRWELRHGPFSEHDFAALPEHDWTLLVQDVDKHVPGVASLLQAFRFLPDWRIDDVMISYAADGGGVGPHTDSYDVFLIQTQGRRRWRLSHDRYSDDDLLPDCDLRVLQTFDIMDEFLLEPGDVLYIPPRFGHWGIADGPCVTCSVGFRGPSQRELFTGWSDHLAEQASQTRHYADATVAPREDHARITTADLHNAIALIESLPDPQTPSFAEWFGCHVTEAKPGLEIEPPGPAIGIAELISRLQSGAVLLRHPYARVAYFTDDEGIRWLFAQATSYKASAQAAALVPVIANNTRLDIDLLAGLTSQDAMAVLCSLVNDGIYEWDLPDQPLE